VPPEIVIPDRFNATAYFVDRIVEEGHGARTAILCGDQAISYQEVLAEVNRAGNALLELGVEIENRVALLLLDCPEFAYAFFGAIKIGAVPVPINTLLKPQDYGYLLRDSRARALIVSAELLSSVESILPTLERMRHVVVVGEAARYASFAQLLQRQAADLEAADTCKDDVAFWLYTSGTTGMSRAAVHLQHDMVYCSRLYADSILNIGPEDRTFSIAKLYFAYGLGNALYCPFAVGASTVFFPGRPMPEAVFTTVKRYRPTLFFGVPTAYAAMLHAAEQGAEADFSSVRLCVSAGEPLPAGLYRRWLDRFGVEILDGIGSTEVLHIFLSNRPGSVRPGSSGLPVPGYEAQIVDDDGATVGPGEIGNLMVRGDSTCAYYWNKHDASRRQIAGEWIRTGDKYHTDEDGYFWYDGRSDDMLKAGGIWVSPTEVEGVIVEHPAVLECAVVGAEDEERLVKPKAYVVLKDGAQAADGLVLEIQELVKGRLAPYKYPRWIEFVDDLPKTATGKIQRYKLRSG
jgi:benzoate-CoA ligase